jgi:hypothetical protein
LPAYEYVIGHAQQILNPTYALSQTWSFC